jgi:hypothetical protein
MSTRTRVIRRISTTSCRADASTTRSTSHDTSSVFLDSEIAAWSGKDGTGGRGYRRFGDVGWISDV